MIKRMKNLLAGAAFVALTAGAAQAAGNLTNGLPIVGGPAYCSGLVNGVCSGTVPAGAPSLTGSELIPADTGLAGGAFPQTEAVPVASLGFGNNRLIGGDFNTNIAQRLSTAKGITSLATLSPTAAVMTADGWWTYAAAAGVTVTIPSGTTEALPALGTTKALRLARTSSGAAGTMCLGQTLDQNQSAPLIGNNAVFSFWEVNGAAMSAANGNITVNVSYSSGTAASATQATLGFAGSQGSKYAIGTQAATFGTGGPTNQTGATPILAAGTAGTIGTNGFVTIPASTTWTRYAIAYPIPTVIPNTTTAVTDVSVEVCFNPVLTTAISTDWIEVQGLQLEAKPGTATSTLPNGVISPSGFERRPPAVEQTIDYSYWYYNFENQALITSVASCADVSVTVSNCNIVFPVPMRIVPNVAYTSGFQLFTTTAYTAVGACTLVAAASYAIVPSNTSAVVQCTATTVPAAGTANILTTLGTTSATGIISASALP